MTHKRTSTDHGKQEAKSAVCKTSYIVKIQRYRLTVTAVIVNFKTYVASTIFYIFTQYYTLRYTKDIEHSYNA